MFVRTRFMLVLLFTFTFGAASTGPAAAQEDDPAPSWVDTMDSAATGLLSENSPDESRFTYQYSDGEYSIQAHATDYAGDLYSYLNIGQPVDTRTSVDFAIENDQPGKYAFVGCRAGETTNGYSFEVHPSTGDVFLWALTETDAILLAEGNALDLISPGFVFNTIEIECWQNLISGAINGDVVLADFDDQFTSGYSYIGAGVMTTLPSDLYAIFDNLEVVDFNAADSGASETTGSSGSVIPTTAPQPTIPPLPTTPPLPTQATQTGAGLFEQLRSQAQTQAPIAGPLSSQLVQSATNFPWLPAGVNMTDLYATATFINPVDISAPWDIGLSIRYDSRNTDARIIVSSDGVWQLTISSGDAVATGQLNSFAIGASALNTLEVVASGSSGAFVLNGLVIAELDLSASPGPGDVFASSGFFSSNVLEGRTVSVQDFSVWAIPGAGPAPTATQVALQPTTQPSVDLATTFQQQKSAAVLNAPLTAPFQGVLVQQAGVVAQNGAGVNIGDLYTAATFLNPVDTSVPWDFGITVRGTGVGDELRFFVTSTGAWYVAVGAGAPFASGQTTNVNASAGGATTIELTAQGPGGIAVVNGVPVAALDLSGVAASGDVYVATGFFNEDILAGRQIPFVTFQVWAIGAPAQPTAASALPDDPAARFDAVKTSIAGQPPAAGPFSGTLTQSANAFPSAHGGVNLTDFYATATFLNPADLSAPWNVGLGLRYSDQNRELRFIIDSGGNWSFATGGDVLTFGGTILWFNSAMGGSNTLEAIVQGVTAYIAVNGQFVTSFDLSANAPSGDVFIGSGFAGSGSVEGRQVPYSDFAVWALPPGI